MNTAKTRMQIKLECRDFIKNNIDPDVWHYIATNIGGKLHTEYLKLIV